MHAYWSPGISSIVVASALLALPDATAASVQDPCTWLAAQDARTAADAASGQQRPVLVYDHATGDSFLADDRGCTAFKPSDGIRLKTSVGLRIVVMNTNTALYSFAVTEEESVAEEIAALQGFTKALGPYLSELGRQFARAQVSPPAPSADPLVKIVNLVYAKRGLRWTFAHIVAALEDMTDPDVLNGKQVSQLSEELGAKIVAEDGPFTRKDAHYCLAAIKHLASAFAELAVKTDKSKDDYAMLDQEAKVLDAAYQVEALGVAALTAKEWWESPEPVEVSWDKGCKLTLKIQPATPAELTRVASRPTKELTTAVRPDWLVRPALGLAFLSAPDATFPKFGTKESGEGVEVVQNGTQDARFTYGLTLGLTWRRLDWRDGSGWALWLPELMVNPSDDVKAVGAGLAVSWKIVKLGAGLLWTKHTALDGQSIGEILPTADSLKTRETYGSGEWYVSLSLIGWPPFTQ